MVGTLAQLIALVSHGNAFLFDGDELKDFYPSNSTFQFCNKVNFVDVKKFIRIREKEIAEDPNHWFEHLGNNDCERLAIAYTSIADPQFPDHLSAGLIGGGGRWDLITTFTGSEDRWFGTWDVTDQYARDRRIWKVTYLREVRNERVSGREGNYLATYRIKLENILNKIEEFARRQELEGFTNCFSNALTALSSRDPIGLIYHKDLLPSTGYCLEAKQLIAASSLAWVFGGMGSWNDLGEFEKVIDQQEYNSLSGELFSAINLAIEGSVNSFSH